MSYYQIFATIIKYLPELVGLVKSLAKKTDDAVETAIIKNRLNQLSKAFAAKNRADAARMANDAFKH